ncbi:hypothetical protein FRC08_017146 [Ceratobasidium sp. 394]|nr:hypothetical protein FRC08_017146 [Ceratobasidium sp. 394]
MTYNIYGHFLIAFPTPGPGTGKFTVDALSWISDSVLSPRSFMANGSAHLNCKEVEQQCKSHGVQPLKMPPNTLWMNGLAKGYVKLLIRHLKHLCSPTVGESPEEDSDPASTPTSCLKHLATAVAQLNNRVLLSLGYAPHKLLTGQLLAKWRVKI